MTNESFELNCRVILNNFSILMEKIINDDFDRDTLERDLAGLAIKCEILKKQAENDWQYNMVGATLNFIFKPSELVS